MEKENDWEFFTGIDFSDETVKMFSVDTRDFHCIAIKDYKEDPKDRALNISKLGNNFFYTPEEVHEIVKKLFDTSGGAVEWRYLELSGDGERVSSNWGLKYLRIERTAKGLVICNASHYAIRKDIFECKVKQEYLNAH
jgi:hypothetical protein